MGEVIEERDLIFRLVRKDEKDKWLKFLPTVFLQTPESYFRRHLEKDVEDNSPFSRIVCAIRKGDEDENLLGTLRVFKRKIIWGNNVYYSSGIGEVSVISSERGKKIATKLLNISSFLIENSTFPLFENEDVVNDQSLILSTLHTGEQAPLYKSIGYKMILRKLVVINIVDLLQSPILDSFQSICEFDFDSHLDEVKILYNEFNSQYYGAIYRSELYWKNWAKAETTDPFLILINNDRVIAYLSAKQYNEGELVLKDFAVSSDFSDRALSIFKRLLRHKVQIDNSKNEKIIIPLPVYHLLNQHNEIKIEREIEDRGFLVKLYSNQFHSPSTNRCIEENCSPVDLSLDSILSLATEENFLFWPTDGF